MDALRGEDCLAGERTEVPVRRRTADSLVATRATKAGVLVMPGACAGLQAERDVLVGYLADRAYVRSGCS